jgi:hypothetical protein
MLTPIFKTRAFLDRPQPSHHFTVTSCTWAALGGPASALLVAQQPFPVDLNELVGLLRCPVALISTDGRAAWSGLVWSIRITDGATVTSFSLDDLANRVRVQYYAPNPARFTGGDPGWSAWADDLVSQAAYGIKELETVNLDLDAAHAAAFRDSILAAQAKPGSKVKITKASQNPTAGPRSIGVEIECRGLFETLGWRCYEQAAGQLINIPNTLNAGASFGTLDIQFAAQSFTTGPAGGWYLDTLWVSLKKMGAPVDYLSIYLFGNGANNIPVGPVLAISNSISGATFSTSLSPWTKFTYPTPYTLAPNTTYWFYFVRSGAFSANDFYALRIDFSLSFAAGVYKIYNGTTWVAFVPDIDLQFYASGAMSNDAQINLLAASSAGGQFLAGVRWDKLTGLFSNPYRPGLKTCKAELLQLLKSGSTTGELLAEVTTERFLVIKSKPTSANPKYKIGSDGILRLPAGAKAPPGPGIAGEWAALDTPWSNTPAGWDLHPGRIFLDTVEWTLNGVTPLLNTR